MEKHDKAYRSDNENVPDDRLSPISDSAGLGLYCESPLAGGGMGSIGASLNVKTVTTIAELRNHEPAGDGDMVVVSEYEAGSGTGGGIFIFDHADMKSIDDHGLILVTPKGARWKRRLSDYNEVNVAFFGARGDGKTDCINAVKLMWQWSQKNAPSIGIKFPAGNFKISSFDISNREVTFFRLAGHQVNSGYYAATNLFSDRKNNEFMFKVNARYMEISGLTINGESTAASPNTKGFYKNIIQAGQFVRVAEVRFLNLGGRGLDMLDTLDCKINQWYASNCSGTVIYAGWSDNPNGKWDHTTAIELSNFNIQHGSKSPAIDLQRATQSLIWNGWIEHTEFPGDISNGQWIINALSVEDCHNPLKCHYSRIVNTQLNLQSGSSLDFSQAGNKWTSLSDYELGDTHIENHGLKTSGTLSCDYFSSDCKMDNRTDKEKWFFLGELTHSVNTTQTRIHIAGTAGFNNMSETQTGYTSRTAEGSADIYLQKIADREYVGCWNGQGSVPVTRVLIEASDNGKSSKVYIKIAKYTGFCASFIETNDFNHFSRVSIFFSKRPIRQWMTR